MACDNSKITNVNHMTNLKILDASLDCGIDDNGIMNMNLQSLMTFCNPKITYPKESNRINACRMDKNGFKDNISANSKRTKYN